MSKKSPMSKRELEARLRELELEYQLAREGLAKMRFTIISALIGGIAMLIFSAVTTRESLSGTHFVIVALALIGAVVIGSAFICGRASRIKAEISETKKSLEISAGDKVR